MPNPSIHEVADLIMEVATLCDGMEVHRDDWAAAELLVSGGRGTLGEARGPGGDFKRFKIKEE